MSQSYFRSRITFKSWFEQGIAKFRYANLREKRVIGIKSLEYFRGADPRLYIFHL